MFMFNCIFIKSLQAYLGRRCQLPRACLNHECHSGATCVPIDETLGRQKRRQKVHMRPSTHLSDYNSYYQKDDEWLEEVVDSYMKEEKNKIRRDGGKNNSTNAVENFKNFFSFQDLQRSAESNGNTYDQTLRKIEVNSIKKMLRGKRGAKRDLSQDLRNYRCLCPPGHYGLHCQKGL